jgi:hypothetical protein
MSKGYQEQMQMPEPLPVAEQPPDWEGMSLFVAALAKPEPQKELASQDNLISFDKENKKIKLQKRYERIQSSIDQIEYLNFKRKKGQ